MSGLAKLLFPDGNITKEQTQMLLEYAIEGRRRVKEQLKTMAGVEFIDVNLGFIDKEEGTEEIIAVPEQTPNTLIPDVKLPFGHVFAVGKRWQWRNRHISSGKQSGKRLWKFGNPRHGWQQAS